MAVGLFVDVHVDRAIVAQLRLRGVDVRTAQDDGVQTLSDDLLLEYASRLALPLFTHDIRFHALAEDWQRAGRAFVGLIFAHPLQVTIGRCVLDLEVLAKGTAASDCDRSVIRLPL